MALLFFSLIALILFAPVLHSEFPGHLVVSVGFILILLSGVYAASEKPHHRFIALVLGAPLIIGYILGEFVDTKRDTSTIGLTYGIPFFVYLTYRMLMYVVRAKRVSASELYCAATVYLLFGFTWAGIYGLVEFLWPGSFSNLGATPDVAWDQLFYYSFVTLTTLGYGDITPQSELARHLAVLQALTGVLSLSFLVARIVSAYKAER
jgi:hypothetical protein